ncbi:hypothetical protein QN219_20040 [Sinorhizobium sp. 7-81]|uniref:hypothetical protein n=1 Tax=Sinorhizobium sp. 8-89 TaxID=3049089 RepID=UPI0024C2506D|nr:hypothetical protein [Sinorhizobium sp. 8-89]MDK1492327.1 hypothetical protein [Sinorhizobium sp. 8-89]
MRIFVTFIGVIALAAAPCAWDSDPREPPAIAALFAVPPDGGRTIFAAQVPAGAAVPTSSAVKPMAEISDR